MTPLSHTKPSELGTKWILVRKSGTTGDQPLDRRIRVYGAVKSRARDKFARMTAIEDNPAATKESTAKLAQKHCKALTKENVLDAWTIEEISVDVPT
jgi:hypothetical protein